MEKFHVKKGDEVAIIAGTEKGKRGKILEVLPQKQRVIVEGAKMIKRHSKKGRPETPQQGAIIEREGTIHISNVMRADRFDARLAKRGGARGAAEGAENQE
jgi:large subunit ribosomal protein L24